MTLLDKALQLERRLKLKPQNIEIIVRVNPCFDCGGCEKCKDFHKEVNADQQGKIIVVRGENEG